MADFDLDSLIAEGHARLAQRDSDAGKAAMLRPAAPRPSGTYRTMHRPDAITDPEPSGMDTRNAAFGTEAIGGGETALRSGAEALLPGAHKLMAAGAAVGDKIAQGVHPEVQQQPWNEVRKEEDATAAERLRRGSLQHPGVAFGANIVGGGLSPLGKAVKGAGLARTIANGAIYGAAQGGFGAEGAGADAGGIAKGALLGAGVGAGGAVVGHAVGKAPKAISDKIHAMRGPIGDDLRIMDKYHGEPSVPVPGIPQRSVVHGGFDKEPVASVSGSPVEIGSASRDSAESILTEQGSRHRAMGNDFAKRSSAIMKSPEGQQIADVTAMVDHAKELLESEATTDAMRGKLRNYIDNRMARYLQKDGTYRMSVSQLHDHKSVLADMAQVGEGKAATEDPAIMGLWKMAKQKVVDTSPSFKALDAEYAAGMQQIRGEQEALGVKRREGVAQNNAKNAATMAGRIKLQAGESEGAGVHAADMERFRRIAPQHEQNVDIPLMLKAKQRMSFPSPLELKGGLANYAGRNIEPTVGRIVDPALRAAATAAPRSGSAAGAALLRGRRRSRVTEPTDEEIAIAGQPGLNEALDQLRLTQR